MAHGLATAPRQNPVLNPRESNSMRPAQSESMPTRPDPATPSSAIQPPATDPTLIFEHFRGSYGSELLTVAVAHFNLFGLLAAGPQSLTYLCHKLGLETRPANVLLTALQAMQLVERADNDRYAVTPLAREHLVPGAPFEVCDYVGLAANAPGVLEMAERLRSNRPAESGDDEGAAFIYREGIKSAMESTALARHFTLALAGRAKNVAPVLADRLSMDNVSRVLDIGGGTGIYSIALLQKHQHLSAVVLDRAEVLKVAAEMAQQYGVADRLELVAGDMFADPLPPDCQAVLLSNILHDWDVPQCQKLVHRAAQALPPGGRLWIHDVYLNDNLDGPLPIALYSAALFTLTEGRAYSQAEYRGWMHDAGLTTSAAIPTLVHCGVLTGTKPIRSSPNEPRR